MSFHTEDSSWAFHERPSVQDSQRCPLLDHELLLDAELLQQLDRHFALDGAQRPINFPFVFLAGLNVMDVVPEIDGHLCEDYDEQGLRVSQGE